MHVKPLDGRPAPAPSDRAHDRGAAGVSSATDHRSGEESRQASMLVAVLAATIPLARVILLWAPAGSEQEWTRRVVVAPFDAVLLVITVWAVTRLATVRALIGSRFVAAGISLYGITFAIAFALHPSWLGIELALRLLGGTAVIAAVAIAGRTAPGRGRVLAAMAAVGGLQAVLAMAQSAHGSAFGAPLLDYAGPLYPFGTSFAGRGGLSHPYHLAVVLLVAQGAVLLGLRTSSHRWPWLLALVTIGAGIGVTYTRAGLIGEAMVVIALLAGRADRRVMVLAAGMILAGLAVGGVAFGDGWVSRADGTVGANPTSSRTTRSGEGFDLFADHPLTGVGPGRYVDALHERPRVEYLPAHDIVVHEAAETGLVGAAAVVLLLGSLAVTVLRSGAWAAAVALPMAPFLLLDAYPYVFATGLATTALWLGLVTLARMPAEP